VVAVGSLAVAVAIPANLGPLRSPSSTGRAATEVYGYINDVSCPTVHFCMAVGYEQNLQYQLVGALVDRWGGATWTRDAAGATANVQLSSVSCVTAAWCMAVGSNSGGGVAWQVWNGSTWSAKAITGLTQAYASSVSCTSPSMCRAVGVVDATSGVAAGFIASWNGHRWTTSLVRPPPAAARTQLSGVSCASLTFCMATGYSQASATSTRTPLVEEWDGSSWRAVTLRAPFGAIQLLGVDCVSTRWCAAVGAKVQGTFSACWNGQRWGTLAAMRKQFTYSTFSSIGCASPLRCVAVGSGAYPRGPSAFTGDLWDGHHWSLSIQDLQYPQGDLGGASCPSPTYCVAAGWVTGQTQAAPLIETWAGRSWAIQTAPS